MAQIIVIRCALRGCTAEKQYVTQHVAIARWYAWREGWVHLEQGAYREGDRCPKHVPRALRGFDGRRVRHFALTLWA